MSTEVTYNGVKYVWRRSGDMPLGTSVARFGMHSDIERESILDTISRHGASMYFWAPIDGYDHSDERRNKWCLVVEYSFSSRFGHIVKRSEVREGEIFQYQGNYIKERPYCIALHCGSVGPKSNHYTKVKGASIVEYGRDWHYATCTAALAFKNRIYIGWGMGDPEYMDATVKIIGGFDFEREALLQFEPTDPQSNFELGQSGIPSPRDQVIDDLTVDECLARYTQYQRTYLLSVLPRHKSEVMAYFIANKTILKKITEGGHGDGYLLKEAQLTAARYAWSEKLRQLVKASEEKRRKDNEVKVQPEFDPWD